MAQVELSAGRRYVSVNIGKQRGVESLRPKAVLITCEDVFPTAGSQVLMAAILRQPSNTGVNSTGSE